MDSIVFISFVQTLNLGRIPKQNIAHVLCDIADVIGKYDRKAFNQTIVVVVVAIFSLQL